ncbi:hypothetical protein BV25DRAFT_1843715 [Artomyces pyxidatus]|uniref:Uncharacterized protein n=1 Tax=Artomyces pyxidatus TaxID=48021 RepID=A0ACB8SF23_9AGAM|nr:hypothetical protein BV25DRAFT_1843715 [Artomyces pyxidatus]
MLDRLADRASLETKPSGITDESRLAIREVTKTHVLQNVTYEKIKVDDFVEVQTFVRILMDGAETGLPRVRLALHPTAVIRLCAAEDVPTSMRRVTVDGNVEG